MWLPKNMNKIWGDNQDESNDRFITAPILGVSGVIVFLLRKNPRCINTGVDFRIVKRSFLPS